MVQDGKIIRVLIASPSDVGDERKALDEVFVQWNATHSWDFGAILEAVKWETHATPFQGTRPQEQINKQLVQRCDIFLGVFGNRLGTDTGVASSGTVEELDQFLTTDRPALLYFSQQLVLASSIDPVQLEKLRDFKKEMRGKGLQCDFDSISSFKLAVLRHLTDTVRSLLSQSKKTDLQQFGQDLVAPEIQPVCSITADPSTETDCSQLSEDDEQTDPDTVVVHYCGNAGIAGLAGESGTCNSRGAEFYLKAGKMAKEKNWNKAIRFVSDSISENPTPQAYYNRGMYRFSLKEQSLALEDFDKALVLGLLPQAAYNAGFCCWSLSKAESEADSRNLLEERAIGYFERAVQLDPTLAEASYNLGLYYLAKGHKKAEDYFSAAYEANSYFAEAAFNLGLAFIVRGNKVKAAESFEKAIMLDGSYKEFVPSFDEIWTKRKVSLRPIKDMPVSGPIGPKGPSI